MDLNDLVERIETRQDLVKFIGALLEDLRTNEDAWENATLERFLDALGAWTAHMDGYFQNVRGVPVPDEPGWKLFGYMLTAARIYE